MDTYEEAKSRGWSEVALRELLAKAWDEGAEALHDTATEAIGYNPGGGPANPYKEA